MPNVNNTNRNKSANNASITGTGASAEDEDILIEEEEDPKKIVGKHDSGAADLAKVTNYGFFDEEGGADGGGASGAISGAARSIIDSKRSKEDAERVAQQKLLANVTVKKEDVELIMHEMEISRTDAELRLRQAMGNVVQALITLINE